MNKWDHWPIQTMYCESVCLCLPTGQWQREMVTFRWACLNWLKWHLTKKHQINNHCILPMSRRQWLDTVWHGIHVIIFTSMQETHKTSRHKHILFTSSYTQRETSREHLASCKMMEMQMEGKSTVITLLPFLKWAVTESLTIYHFLYYLTVFVMREDACYLFPDSNNSVSNHQMYAMHHKTLCSFCEMSIWFELFLVCIH